MSPSILHVSQPREDGVARCVAALAADQVARGWTVAVATRPAGDLANDVRTAGAAVVPWQAGRELGPNVTREVVRLARILRATKPDLVHLHSSKAALAGRPALGGGRPAACQPLALVCVGEGER